MSINRYFKLLRPHSLQVWRNETIERACIHCSAVHRKESAPHSPAAILQKPKRLKQKEEVISEAMKSYLERRAVYDKKVVASEREYQLGKRHLANIMGVDEETFTQEQIKAAVQYLLPSGLFAKKARPIMENTMNLLPKLHAAQFSKSGKPNHYLFYTASPTYYETMHRIVWKLEMLKDQEDAKAAELRNCDDVTCTDYYAGLEKLKLDGIGSDWLTQKTFEKKFPDEKLHEPEYKRFCVLLERLMQHPLSYQEKEFIFHYRVDLSDAQKITKLIQPKLDSAGRRYSFSPGSRKSSKAYVTVYGMGSGNISINDDDITYFQELTHRKQVLFPLQFTEKLGDVDIVAQVEGGGPTGQSGAIRLGVARALTAFVTPDVTEKMRLAGLLTRDPRVKERQKAGRERARKKFTWKKR